MSDLDMYRKKRTAKPIDKQNGLSMNNTGKTVSLNDGKSNSVVPNMAVIDEMRSRIKNLEDENRRLSWTVDDLIKRINDLRSALNRRNGY